MVDVASLLTGFAMHAPFALALLDHDLRFIFVNEAMAAINGLPADAHIGKRVWEVVSDDSIRTVAEPLLNQVLTTGEPVFSVRLTGATGACADERCWVEDFLPVHDDNGAVIAVAGLVRDVTEDQRTKSALRESQEHLRLALNAAQLGTWERDIKRDVYDGDAWARRIFGIVEEGPLPGADVRRRIHPDDRVRVLAAPNPASSGPESSLYEIEYRIITDAGEQRWVSVRGSLDFDEANTPVRFLGTVRDVTREKLEEDRRQLLVAELDHRVKNILGLVSTLVSQSLEGKKVPRGAHDDLQARIQSLATAHRLISRTGWHGAVLRDLVEAELSPYSGTAHHIGIAGDTVIVAPETVQPLAMALHELVSNAAKHGALAQPGGHLEVTWLRRDDGTLAIAWKEAGVVLPKATGQGFGSRLLQEILPRHKGLHIDLRLEADGATCSITLGPSLWTVASLTPRASDEDALNPERPGEITGSRVLIAEDEMLIAYDLEEELRAAGCEVVANCQDVRDVEAALDRVRPDVAILDINLRGELVYPAAERLRVLGIPFIFASGYEAALNVPDRFSGVPTVSKPYRAGSILGALRRAVTSAR